MKNIQIFQTSQPIRAGPLADSPLTTLERFNLLLKGSERILLKTSSVFPFDFFPDEITIDEYKVSIIFHAFFLSEDIHSIAIEMIKDIEMETGPLFATLKIIPDGYPGQPLKLKFLKKKDAIKARRLIQGLIIAKRQGIDPTKLDIPDFVDQMESLGKTHLTE